ATTKYHNGAHVIRHHPFYCEENIWWLAQDPAIERGSVLFITNAARAVVMDHQKAARRGRPIAWDYHVVLIASRKLWDLDWDRVGVRALVPRKASGRPVPLSRTELDSAPPSGSPARQLEVPFLSRAPIELTATNDVIAIEAPERAAVKIDGEEFTGKRTLSFE